MTIKKLKTATTSPAPRSTEGGAAPEAPAQGGATIADRFKLDTGDAKKKGGTVSRKSAMFALIAGLLALAVAGLLTFTIWKHWEFLMAA